MKTKRHACGEEDTVLVDFCALHHDALDNIGDGRSGADANQLEIHIVSVVLVNDHRLNIGCTPCALA